MIILLSLLIPFPSILAYIFFIHLSLSKKKKEIIIIIHYIKKNVLMCIY